jgi:hypothetical protein
LRSRRPSPPPRIASTAPRKTSRRSFSKSTTVESPRPAACTSCDCVIPSSVERTRNRTKNHERVEPAGAPATGSRCSWRTIRVARPFVVHAPKPVRGRRCWKAKLRDSLAACLQRGRGKRFWNDEPTGICCLLGRRAEALRAYLASPGWGDQPLVPARVDCLRPKMRHCLEEASSARAPDGSRGIVNVRLKYI